MVNSTGQAGLSNSVGSGKPSQKPDFGERRVFPHYSMTLEILKPGHLPTVRNPKAPKAIVGFFNGVARDRLT